MQFKSIDDILEYYSKKLELRDHINIDKENKIKNESKEGELTCVG